jgi:succinate dehydrogenase / fumarate reductase cytochrome b subunit
MATIVRQPAQPPVSSSGPKGVPPLRPGEGHSFLLRRLHSLSGIIPIGAFLIEHIVSNFEALKGPLAYAEQVKFLNSLPLVRVLEWVFIFLPLLYHGLYGLYIWLRGKSNVIYYPWAGNWMYTAQRWTGGIAFVFIVQHLWRQRFTGVHLPTDPGAAFHKVQVELSHPWMLAFYIVAMIATSWHFAYGAGRARAAELRLGLRHGRRAALRYGPREHLRICGAEISQCARRFHSRANLPGHCQRPTRRYGRTLEDKDTRRMAAGPKIIVIGGGLAGLSAVIKIAEAGGNVDLFSIVPVKRSHSVCAQGGI